MRGEPRNYPVFFASKRTLPGAAWLDNGERAHTTLTQLADHPDHMFRDGVKTECKFAY